MHSKTDPKFRKAYQALPKEVRLRARRAYLAWLENPHTHGLNFKMVNPNGPIYSVRIGLDYRAIGILRGDTMIWYWIGHHTEYERLI